MGCRKKKSRGNCKKPNGLMRVIFAGNKKAAHKRLFLKNFLVGLSRLELLTPTMSRWCSNQLSYSPILEARTLTKSHASHKHNYAPLFVFKARAIIVVGTATITVRNISAAQMMKVCFSSIPSLSTNTEFVTGMYN